MSMDFLLDLELEEQFLNLNQAVSVKYSQDLVDERTLEKQEIERLFWEGEGVDWYLFTEQDVPIKTVKNIRWLVPNMHSFDLEEALRIGTFERIAKALDGNPEEKNCGTP